MTYAELLQAIQDYAVDVEPSFLTHIPQMVRATERRIFLEADVPVAQKQSAPTVSNGVATVIMPSDFMSVDSFAIIVSGAHQFLLPKTVDFLQEAYPTAATTGVPRYFAVKTEALLQLGPIPGAAYTSQLRYLGFPTSIVDAGTSWLGANFDGALLYGALHDAAAYLKADPDVVAMYDARYQEALGILKGFAATRARQDRYRTR
jgi:hypothetical protein